MVKKLTTDLQWKYGQTLVGIATFWENRILIAEGLGSENPLFGTWR